MNVTIVGSGVSGLVSACYLARGGYKVNVYEKNSAAGGRASQLIAGGFIFDMGPSWYWMPDVFEDFFHDFGKSTSSYYSLKRLEPSYSVYFDSQKITIPSNTNALYALFESLEKGSSERLQNYLEDAAYKYKLGMGKFAQKPSLKITEYIDKDLLSALTRLQLFSNMRKHVNDYFSHPILRKIIEFPVIFLGAMPDRIPAMYSLMNYADAKLGTWYPMGGMYKIVEGIYQLAKELGVVFHFNTDIKEIKCEKNRIVGISYGKGLIPTDLLINSADYRHMESLLPPKLQSYSSRYWSTRKMAPSSLIFFLGLNKKLNINHHSLFFDADYDQHAGALYNSPSWPSDPMFYVCTPSVSDEQVAPPGSENLFVLIPVAAGLDDIGKDKQDAYLDLVLNRMEKQLRAPIKNHIVYKRSYSINNFKEDFYAFKGNAYGLANTLDQTAFLKPSIKSKKLKNLFYCGQLTNPGPGVPPSIISGKLAAMEALKNIEEV